MRLVINIVLLAITAVLAWLLMSSIQEPIKFKTEKDKREFAVQEALSNIRTAQEHYRGITGEFAPSFDTLREVLSEGRFAVIKAFGDRDATSGDEIRFDTTWVEASDSMSTLGLVLDGIEKIPFGEGQTFDIKADTITYQSTLVHVCEVGAKRSAYMSEFPNEEFQMYDKAYDQTSYIKIGDMYKPSLSGNW